MIRVDVARMFGTSDAEYAIESETGDYVLLGVSDYNSLVRQINMLKLLVCSQFQGQENGIVDKLIKTHNEVIDDRKQ